MEQLLANDSPKVIILGGLPGAGKTTFRKQYEKDYFIICKDDIRLWFAQQKYGNIPESLITDLEKFSKNNKFVIPALIELYFNQSYIDIIKDNFDLFMNLVLKKDYAKTKSNIKDYVLSRFEDMTNKKGIIFDATHYAKCQRKEMLHLVNHRCPAYIIYFNVDVDTAKERNLKRASTIIDTIGGINIYGRNVPDNIIESFAKYEKLPSKKEGFKEVFIM